VGANESENESEGPTESEGANESESESGEASENESASKNESEPENESEGASCSTLPRGKPQSNNVFCKSQRNESCVKRMNLD